MIPVSGTIEHRDVGWPKKVPHHIARRPEDFSAGTVHHA
jgi:hypothetical protein